MYQSTNGYYTTGTLQKTAQSTTVQDGLVARYSFDASTGTDDSGNGNNGAFPNGGGFASGKVSTSVVFDGVNDYISINHASTLQTSSTISIAAWIKTTSSSIQTIVEKERNSSPFDGYELAMSNVSAGKVSFRVGGNARTTSTTSVNDGNRHHVIAIYDGVSAKLSIDGGAFEGTQAQTADLTDDDGTLNIGARRNGTERRFTGALDEVRLYNRALSTGEIYELYASAQSLYLTGECNDTTATLHP